MFSKKIYYTLFALANLFYWTSCQHAVPVEQKIQQLEQVWQASHHPDNATALVNAYREAVQQQPNQHTQNFHYLTKAADIQYFMLKDPVSAARSLDHALAHHNDGQSLAAAAKTYALIYHSYLYQNDATLTLGEDDVQKMRQHLLKNAAWLDTALHQLDHQIQASFTTGLDVEACRQYVEVSEAYAQLIGKQHPRYFELINQAAALSKTAGQPQKAIALYENLLESEPNPSKAAQLTFMLGFIYENDLKDLAAAKKKYSAVLDKFSSDKVMAENARLALKNLGKSPEQILKEAGVK